MQAVVMYGGGGGGGVKGSISTKSLAVGFRALKSQKQHYTSSLDFSNRNSQLSSSSSSSSSSSGLRLNSLSSSSSMATELTRSSLFHSRPVLKALASNGGDVEEVRPLKSEDDVTCALPVPQQQQGKASVLPFVGVACLGAILFGYHLGVVNGALEYLAKDLGIVENAVLQGWIVSTLLAGATVGSFTGGALADKFGRTRTFQLDAIPLAIGAVLCATAQSVQSMIIGRLLAGIGIGISSAIVPLYISEISPTEIRGVLGSVNQLFICIGILLALVAGLPLAGNPIWWRTMFSISAVPAVLLALGMAFSPESPRWLFQQGKFSEVEKSINTLYGKERVADVMTDLNVVSQGSAEQEAGWFDLFSSRYWKVVSVGVALFFFQQMAGINAVVYYSTAVFRSAGIESDVAASALVGASNVFGTTIASSLMDRQGRKSLLITSFLGMAASMLLLSLSFTWKALAPYSGTLAVLGTVCYVLSFSLGAGPVPALLLPEIFSSRIRAKAVALSLGMHWAANFVIGLYFLSFVNKFGISSVYLGFSGICLLGVLYIAANVVETKGRSLEEIERALDPAV
ncbi:PREDICTED: plastidic glucose transporter 4 isoform X1 [Populus euphratica]|uniref:Plastidic glucose transporter 4 isoform X1 n=1 Tax=Populus euphratica TaxID=75702 RepID=A0AAJ6XJS6_POPEU|nr:PREDICTED: plastidic glucose transporter 4 isoform X1 [Populus euphratica]